MKLNLLNAVIMHAEGEVSKRIINLNVLENNPVGIGEHSNIAEAVENELLEMSKYLDILDAADFYIKMKNEIKENK